MGDSAGAEGVVGMIVEAACSNREGVARVGGGVEIKGGPGTLGIGLFIVGEIFFGRWYGENLLEPDLEVSNSGVGS
jgi:hypothetical protein